MKRFLMLSVLLMVMMIITPLISVRYNRVIQASAQPEAEFEISETIKVMASDNGFIKEMDTREYLIGCVAGEMPPTYHTEALKAQAVAGYTYAKYISLRDKDKLGGADISDDSTLYQAYINKSVRKEKWGNDFEKNEKIISDAVDSVLYCYLSYENKPAMTVYHNISSDRTEGAENVWGKAFSYLVSVNATGDRLSPDFKSEKEFSIKELKSILKENNIEYSDKITVESRYNSGYVKSIKIGSKSVSGSDFRDMFSLRSADFDVETQEDKIKIICRGNGHFVGMSQYGADYMARQGATFEEILLYYYPGTELKRLKN